MNGRTPRGTTLLSMLGSVANVPNGRRMAEIAARCEYSVSNIEQMIADAPSEQRRETLRKHLHTWKRQLKRWLAPRLAALFSDALAAGDAKPFEDFAKIIRAVQTNNTTRQHAHPFHAKALSRARLVRLENDLAPGAKLPVTQRDFLKTLGVPEKGHDEGSYERRELKRLGIQFVAAKRGREKGTSKPRK